MVIHQSWDISGHPSIDSLWVAVIFQVLVVCEYLYFVWGSHKEVPPVFQAPQYCQEFSVVDVIVSFCCGEGFREIAYCLWLISCVSLCEDCYYGKSGSIHF